MENLNSKELIGLSPNDKWVKLYKKSLNKLSDMQQQAIIGLMLGDASLQTQNRGKLIELNLSEETETKHT